MASSEDLDYHYLSHLYECLAVAVDVNRLPGFGDYLRFVPQILLVELPDLSLQVKSEILSYYGKQVKIQLYGSSVEGLNVDFVPDYDVMIFPTSHDLTIDEELIEYIYLPGNAMHVRIKGADHPLLQSCLVDNTGYVATSALKNLHPAIYEPNQITDSENAVVVDVLRAFHSGISIKNSMTSPAIKISSFLNPNVPGTFKNELVGDIRNEGEEELPHLHSSVDIIPALRSLAWPEVAQEWITRPRKWPLPSKVEKVIREGFHLVVKAPKSGGNPECDFRISFSHAEYLLSLEMNDIQRQCYRCLKKYHQVYLSTEPKGVNSFHLKNIFLRTIEETGAEMWIESRRAECMSKLFANLLETLRKEKLPHYFVQSYNLFDRDYIEDPATLESLAKKVERVMENPVKFAEELILVTRSRLRSSSVQEQKQSKVQLPELFLSLLKKVNEDGSIANYSPHNLMTSHLVTKKERLEKLLEGWNDVFCMLDDRDWLERRIVEDQRAEIEILIPKIKSNIRTTVKNISLTLKLLEALLQLELQSLSWWKKVLEDGSIANYFHFPGHNLKEVYLAVIKDLIEALKNPNGIPEDPDHLERTMVEYLTEMRKENYNIEKLILTNEACFQFVCAQWLLGLGGQSLNDIDIRYSVLASMKQYIELAKYCRVMDSAGEEENVWQVISKHMFDAASEVPFDLNIILPSGLDEDKKELCRTTMTYICKKLYDAQRTNTDDIPLD